MANYKVAAAVQCPPTLSNGNIMSATYITVNCVVATLPKKMLSEEASDKNTNTASFHLHEGSIVKLTETESTMVGATGRG